MMDGNILVSYKVLCESDIYKEISVSKLLENEKVLRAIKSEFVKGARNLDLSLKNDATIKIETQRKVYTFEVSKDDFADILSLAEEDAKNKKLFKKECERVELVDIQTH